MKNTRSLAYLSLLTAAALLAWSCGGTNGGPEGERNYDGSTYVDDDGTAGTIDLQLNEDLLNVSEETGFFVTVRDGEGNPVPNIEIACDTEKGLALIEPTTGFEMTDEGGKISGRVGCDKPGSYRMGCRLPSGAYKRDFETLRCSGPIPPGFSGFPGAGGGTLGNGGEGGGGGSADESGKVVLITDIAVRENNATDTTSIDVIRDTCTSGTTSTPEPFTDTLFVIKVKNNTSRAVDFFAFSYEVEDADSAGNNFSSREVAPTRGGSVAAGAENEITVLAFTAIVPGKRFNGASTDIPADLGFRSVRVNLRGVNAAGEDVEISSVLGLSFGHFDKCTTTGS